VRRAVRDEKGPGRDVENSRSHDARRRRPEAVENTESNTEETYTMKAAYRLACCCRRNNLPGSCVYVADD
jgi:hypothetical protein